MAPGNKEPRVLWSTHSIIEIEDVQSKEDTRFKTVANVNLRIDIVMTTVNECLYSAVSNEKQYTANAFDVDYALFRLHTTVEKLRLIRCS